MPSYPAGLTRAIRQDDPDALARVLARLGPEALRWRRQDGSDALSEAVGRGAVRALAACLRLGADPNRRFGPLSGPAPQPPLHQAARLGRPGCTRVLLGHGAHVDLADHPAPNAGLTALFWAALYRNPRTGLALLEAGADPNRLDQRARAPLHECARLGSPRLAELLLRHGANADLPDFQGHTAEVIAERLGHRPVLEVIRAHRRHAVLGLPAATHRPASSEPTL